MSAKKGVHKRKRVLFVCTGNTCRSPMAEAILRHKLKKSKIKWWDVSSAGINAEVGGDMSKNSRAVLTEEGIEIKSFSPTQLTQKLIEKSTVVVCMTESQRIMLSSCGRIWSVRDICGFDVPDPYGMDINAYRATFQALSEACDQLIKNYILKYEEKL